MQWCAHRHRLVWQRLQRLRRQPTIRAPKDLKYEQNQWYRQQLHEYLRRDRDHSLPARPFRRLAQQKLTACPRHKSPRIQHQYCDLWRALGQ